MKKYLLLLIILPFIFIQEVNASTIDTINISESQAINYKQHTAGFYQWRDSNWITIQTGDLMYFNTYFSGINLQQKKYDYFTFNTLINLSNLPYGGTDHTIDNYHIQGNSFGVSVSYYYYQDSYSNMHQVTCDMSSTYSGIFVKCPIPNKSGNLVLDRIHFTIAPPPVNQTGKYICEYNVSDFFNFIATSEKDISDINQNTQDTTNAINDTKDTLKDDNVDSSDSTLQDLQGDIATNNVISDLLLLPVTLYQKVINSLNGSCSPFNLGTLYEHNLTLPCINLQNYLGSSIFTTIDLILSGLFVLVIRKKFVDIFNNMTNLKNGGNEVE